MASAQIACFGQPVGQDVDDRHVPDAAGAQGQVGHQADAAGTEHDRGLTQCRLTLSDRMEPDGQRFDQGTGDRIDRFRKLKAKRGIVRDIFLEDAVDRRGGEKDDVRAQVVAPGAAKFAGAAGFSGLQRHPVACLKMADRIACTDDNAGTLVAQHKGRFDDKIADPSMFIIVKVGTVNPDRLDFDQDLVILGHRHGPRFPGELPDTGHHGRTHRFVHPDRLLVFDHGTAAIIPPLTALWPGNPARTRHR